jgi:ribose transport system substrate-binding protein
MRLWYLLILLQLFPWQFSAAEQTTSKQQIFTVAYAQDNLKNDWRATQVKRFVEFFSAYSNIRFIYTDGQGSTAKQIQDIEDLIHSKVDILMTSPRDSRAMTAVVRKAYRQGIPVVLVTRNIESNDYSSFIAPNDVGIARQAARYMAKQLNGKGRILILKGVPTATTAIARTQGFMHEIKKYPGISIVATLDGNYLRSDAIKVTQTALEQGLQFDAVYAQSDSMATGVRLALKKARINPADKIIVGIDYIREAREAILKGEQTASFVYPMSVKQAGNVVLKILAQKKFPKRVLVPSQLVTRSNAPSVTPTF